MSPTCHIRTLQPIKCFIPLLLIKLFKKIKFYCHDGKNKTVFFKCVKKCFCMELSISHYISKERENS
jgi:hypothetical protein